MTEVYFKFLKERYYNGKKYNSGDVIKIPFPTAKVFENFKAGYIFFKNSEEKNINVYETKTYKEIQNICKGLNIPAVGKKSEMIESILNHLNKNKNKVLKKEGA